MSYQLELHIEHLVVTGFDSLDRDALSAAVQQELSWLFSEHGVPAGWMQSGTFPRLDGAAFEMTPGMRASTIGAQIARSIYGGLQP